LSAALAGDDHEGLAREAGTEPDAVQRLAALLLEAGSQQHAPRGADPPPREVAVLWGERLVSGPRGAHAARALLEIAQRLDMAATDGAGLLEVPAGANGRGLREAGVLPNAGPGLSPAAVQGAHAEAIARALADGELSALYLLQCDPVRELPGRELWQRALANAGTVIAHASFPTAAISEHADIVFPAESHAEKEGTIVHPDGRLQRLRPAIARPGSVRAGWQVLADVSQRLGTDLGVTSAAVASRQLFDAVPFYAGLTLEEIGGRGVRWQERAAASAFPAPERDIPEPLQSGEDGTPGEHGGAREDSSAPMGYRSLWDAPEVEFSPSLRFLSGGSAGGAPANGNGRSAAKDAAVKLAAQEVRAS
jgi:NADH-quinone oxidoreductase subunit G